MENKWLVIVNPNSGKRKGEKDWAEISSLLEKAKIDFKAIFTSHRLHAIYLVQDYIKEGYRKIIVVGGDGTLNEVINGIMFQDTCIGEDVTVGIIPVGTSNDWCKTFNIPTNYNDVINVIKKCNTILHDVGKVTYFDKQKQKTRFIINSAGIGFEALVVAVTNHQKDTGKGNSFSYIINVIKYFFTFKGRQALISIDNSTEKKINFYALSIGICKYKGNGIKLLPHAVPNDGKLSGTIIYKNLSKLRLVSKALKILKGKFKNLKFISTFDCKSVTVKSLTDNLMTMEVDGESLGNGPYSFEIIPCSVNMIINENIKEK